MKKIYRPLLLFSFLIVVIYLVNDVIIDKSINRYYMLDKAIERRQDDVLIFGSCHAYTSFDPTLISNNYGISIYNISNPSELIPVTYLRLKEQIKKHKPEVVVIEAWGINLYDTYLNPERSYDYQVLNLECIPLSLEKIILDVKLGINLIDNNFLITKYKNRIVNGDISSCDFRYSYSDNKKRNNVEKYDAVFDEMDNRLSRNGYLPYPITVFDNDFLNSENEEVLPPEDVVVEYLDKIIDICKKNDIDLIFYKAPYSKNIREVQRFNWLSDYLASKNVEYYDMEKEVAYDFKTDFFDKYHLSIVGSQKTTNYLNERIMNHFDNQTIVPDNLSPSLYDISFDKIGFVNPTSGEVINSEAYKYTSSEYYLEKGTEKLWVMVNSYTPTMVFLFFDSKGKLLNYYGLDDFSQYVIVPTGSEYFLIYTDVSFSGELEIHKNAPFE